MTAVVAALAVVVVLLAVLVAGLLRSHAEILRRLHELGVGLDDDAAVTPSRMRPPVAPASADRPDGDRPVPSRRQRPGRRAADLVGVTLEQDPVAVRVAGVEQDTVLLFLSSGCATCGEFWSGLVEGRVAAPPGARLVVVTRGPDRETPAGVADLAPAGVPIVMTDDAWDDYRVQGSPYVIHVDGPSGRVRGEGTGQDWSQVARMLAEATGDVAYLGSRRGRRRKAASDAAREQQVDAELLAAGILPGDASLYPGQPRPDSPPQPHARQPRTTDRPAPAPASDAERR